MKNLLMILLMLIAKTGFSQCVTGSVNVAATPSTTSNQVTLNWNGVSTANGWNLFSLQYSVKYGIGNTNSTFVAGAATSATITGLTLGANYSFRIQIVTGCQNIADPSSFGNDNFFSNNTVSATIIPDVPTLTTGVSNSSTSVDFSWNAVNGATGYDVEVTNAAGVIVTNPINVQGTTFNAPGLTPATSYFYRVRARNGTGTSVGYSAKSPAVFTRPDLPTFPATSATQVTTTSFQANWNAVTGATGYQIDVSLDPTFNSNIIYNNQSVNGTTFVATVLTGATLYYYRVRAVNSSGASVNSVRNQILTAPIVPVSFSMSSTTATSSIANWAAAATATQYELFIATDPGFNFPVTNYNPKVIAAPTLTETISGLTASTNYFLKLRAKSGTSSYSDFIFTSFLTPTPPAAPTFPLAPVSGITTTSFQVSWNPVTSASSYQFDASIDPNFLASFVVSNQTVNGTTSPDILGLTGGTLYYFRVRAVTNSNVSSANSTVVQVLTAPVAPPGFSVSSSTASSLTVNWVSAPTTTRYELFAATDPDFKNPVTNYNPKTIESTVLSDVINGLTTSTTYYLRLRALNGTNSYSGYSSTSAAPTGDSGIQFSNLSFPNVHNRGVAQEVSVDLNGRTGTIVTFYHKKNSESVYSSKPIVASGTTYKISLEESWFDDLGMQFYFDAQDQVSQVTSPVSKIAFGVSNVVVPIAGFGGEVKNYQMITIPYQLPGRPLISDAFEQVMGDYNKKKWRLFHYQEDNYVEYSDGVKASDLQQGQSYWFLSKDEITLALGQGNSYNTVDDKNPFLMTLKKGWNQIGNPFPHPISWHDVLSANPDFKAELLIFDKTNVSFTPADSLKTFEGGFILAENNTTLNFPATLRAKNGRTINPGGNTNVSSRSENELNWALPFRLTQGEVSTSLSGIGMNVAAHDDKDDYDRVTPPRFLRYLEMNAHQPGYPYNLSQDIVNIKDNHTWNFLVESNSAEPVHLTWSKQTAGSLQAQLLLYDNTNQVLVNMTKVDSYVITPGATISFRYSNALVNLDEEKIELGKPYPNPFQNEIVIPVYVVSEKYSIAELVITDCNGRTIHKNHIGLSPHPSGVQLINWDGLTDEGINVAPGIYIYQLRIHQETEMLNFKGKIIRK